MTTTAILGFSRGLADERNPLFNATQTVSGKLLMANKFQGPLCEHHGAKGKEYSYVDVDGRPVFLSEKKTKRVTEMVYNDPGHRIELPHGALELIKVLSGAFDELLLFAEPTFPTGIPIPDWLVHDFVLRHELPFSQVYHAEDIGVHGVLGCADLVIGSDLTQLRRIQSECGQRVIYMASPLSEIGADVEKIPINLPHGVELGLGHHGVMELLLNPVGVKEKAA